MMGWAVIAWALCLLGAGAMYLLAPTGWTAAVAAAAALLPLLSGLLSYIGSRGLTVDLRAPESCEKNDPVELELQLHSRSVIPLLRVRAELAAEDLLTGETQVLRERFAAGRGRTEIRLQARPGHCGMVRLELRQLRAEDVFGIFSFRVRGGPAAELLVVPPLFEIRPLFPQPASPSADSEEYSQTRPGRDLSNVFQIRDYAEGDSPRQIHWKLSTKCGRLVVKDPGLPLDRYVLILWERGSEGETPAQADAMAQTLLSLCSALTRRGIGCRVVWNEPGAEVCADLLVRSEEELYEHLPKLLSAGACRDSVVERFLQLYGPEREKKVVFLTSGGSDGLNALCAEEQLTVLLCGCADPVPGRAICFDADDAAQTLFELDLS